MEHLSEKLENILSLSKISLNSIGKKNLEKDLMNILNILNDIKSFDTFNFEPLISPLELLDKDFFDRNDTVISSSCSLTLKDIAPENYDDHFLVPKVIDHEKD